MTKNSTLTRRQVLTRMASVMVAVSLMPYSHITFAERTRATNSPLIFVQFLKISKKITEYNDLDAELSARYFNVLHLHFPAINDALSRLYSLSEQSRDAVEFKQLAGQNGLGDLINAIVLAWYTGTVDPEGEGPGQVVAYKDALMYRTVEDALIVPTWCTYGPMWWTGLPPGVVREPEVPATDLPGTTEKNKDQP